MTPERVSDYTRKILSETKSKFSINRLISECSEKGGLRDGVEHEVCSEAARGAALAFDLNRPIVPWSALATQQRDANVSGTGGYLVQTDVKDAIDTLRPWSVSVRAGISVAPNLQGTALIPKTTASVTAYWLNSETTSITPTAPTLAQLPLAPHTAGAVVNVSRLLLRQSTQTEPFIRRELLRTIGTAIDHAVLNGASGAEPLGVLGMAGIGTTAGASVDWDDVLGMVQTVSEANCDDEVISFIGTPAVRKLLSNRERATGSGFIWTDGRIAGQPGRVTTDTATASLICAAWPEVLLAMWGPGIELQINPHASFATGGVAIRCLVSCDVALAHAAALNAATSIS